MNTYQHVRNWLTKLSDPTHPLYSDPSKCCSHILTRSVIRSMLSEISIHKTSTLSCLAQISANRNLGLAKSLNLSYCAGIITGWVLYIFFMRQLMYSYFTHFFRFFVFTLTFSTEMRHYLLCFKLNKIKYNKRLAVFCGTTRTGLCFAESYLKARQSHRGLRWSDSNTNQATESCGDSYRPLALLPDLFRFRAKPSLEVT